jgi:hypothetical protein
MSDEQEQPRDPAGREPRPDETRPFSSSDDDDDAARVGGNHPDDGPRSGDAWVFDRTEQTPRVDDPTAVSPGPARPDATSIMPPVDAEPAWGAAEAPWSGRAEVRPPRSGEYPSTDWTTEPPAEPPSKWWMPIVIGILALVLLALLGVGIWLIVRAQNKADTTPAPAISVTAPATARPTTQDTTQAATTQPTTAAPTVPAVTIPALRGMSQDAAREALSRRGLSSRLRFVNSTDASPGTVIDSDPAEGQQVPPDTVVTLVIAAQPQTTPPPTTTGASAPADDD